MRASLLLAGILAPRLLAAEPVAPTPATPVTPIPIEHFFAEPDYAGMEIAPDGRHLAFLTTLNTGRVGIALMDLATGKIEPLVAAKDENYEFLYWKGPDHVVFGGDLGGNESLSLRSIQLSTRKVVSLVESFHERYPDRANQAQLDKFHKPYEYLRLDTEGHGFRKEENRILFYRALETFFATNLRESQGEKKILPGKGIELPAQERK